MISIDRKPLNRNLRSLVGDNFINLKYSMMTVLDIDPTDYKGDWKDNILISSFLLILLHDICYLMKNSIQ